MAGRNHGKPLQLTGKLITVASQFGESVIDKLTVNGGITGNSRVILGHRLVTST